MVTHYQRLLNYIQPDFVHVMQDGRIVKTGDKNLAMELEERGYEWVEQEVASHDQIGGTKIFRIAPSQQPRMAQRASPGGDGPV